MRGHDDEISDIKRLSAQYETLVKDLDIAKCVYCGAPATDIEHVVPYSWFRASPHRTKSRSLYQTVKSCHECNLLASNKVFDTFLQKCAYILGKVEERYKKLLNSPEWDEREIRELSGKLRRHVYASTQVRKFVRLRIENLSNPIIPEHLTEPPN